MMIAVTTLRAVAFTHGPMTSPVLARQQVVAERQEDDGVPGRTQARVLECGVVTPPRLEGQDGGEVTVLDSDHGQVHHRRSVSSRGF